MKLVTVAAALACLALPASAAADSIVYTKDKDVWLANPDGTRQTQITDDGGHGNSVTQSEDGTIVTTKPPTDCASGTQLIRLDRAGNVLATDTMPLYWCAGDIEISPDGRHVAIDAVIFKPGKSPESYTYVTCTPGVQCSSTTLGSLDSHNPVWLGNDRVVTFAWSPRVLTLVGGMQQGWLSTGGLVFPQYLTGDVSRDATKFVTTLNAGNDEFFLRFHTLAGQPTRTCADVPIEDSYVNRVRFSPDGKAVVYEQSAGLHIGRMDYGT